MKILIVASTDETIGGVASVVGNLARYLDRRGHEVLFFNSGYATCLKKKTTKWGLPGFELNLQLPFGERHMVVGLAVFLFRFPIIMYHLIRILRTYKVDVVNIHYPADSFVYFGLCRLILPFALITSVHGAELFPGGRAIGRYSRAMRLLLKSSDRIVTPSEGYKKDVARAFPKLEGKITCIYNGVNLCELQVVTNELCKSVKLPYLLCIAMHNEKKGLDVLLYAFAELQKTHPFLDLVLVGDGPLTHQLKVLAARLAIIDKVKFLGRQGRSRVAELLRDCEVFVLPSRSEPFGIVLIEAMAFRKPIVSTRVGGIPEIIEDRKNGILVEPDAPNALAEAICMVLGDKDLRSTIAENGYCTVHKRFLSEHTGATYEAMFYNTVETIEKRPAN